MEHSKISDYIKLFFEGGLSIKEEKELLEWVKSSVENEKYFYYLQNEFGKDLKKSYEKEIAVKWLKFLQNIDPQLKKEVTATYYFKKYYRRAIFIAAAFFIGIFIASLFFRNLDKTVQIASTEQKINTPYGARTQFMLPDSSLVWLNSGSELLFPSRFSRDRTVKLEGEAYFEVKQDENPFLIRTSYGNVEVKGTSFNVKAYNEDIFETTLVRGAVNVVTNKSQKAMLLPGFQAVDKGDGLKVNQVEIELYTSWTEGKLIFRDEYLPALARRFERWYNVKIEVDDDPRIRDISYTGTLELESFSEVLNLLRVTAPVDYTWDEKTRIIRIFYKKIKE